MKVTKVKDIDGPLIIEPEVHGDERGFFMETYRHRTLKDHDINYNFVQDNHSRSVGTVVRGLHYQVKPFAMAKLVRCIVGKIFNVCVDLRKNSPTFGDWFGVELSAENKKQLLVPEYFANGFCTLTEESEMMYKCGDYYSQDHEFGLKWDDPRVGIEWPVKDPLVSEKDQNQPLLKDVKI